MPASLKSRRMSALRNRFDQTWNKEFTPAYLALYCFLGTVSLGRKSIMSARKMAYQLQERWASDPVCREKCDELVARVDQAVQRLQRREEKRAAWKEQEKEALDSLIKTPTLEPAASTTPEPKRPGRPPKTAAAHEATPTPVTESRRKLWESIAEGANVNRT
jgi:hypothetical protein